MKQSSHLNKKYFGRFDALLDDSKSSNLWLQNGEIAKIVADKLLNFDNKKISVDLLLHYA